MPSRMPLTYLSWHQIPYPNYLTTNGGGDRIRGISPNACREDKHMPKHPLRTATVLALLALIAVIAISLLTTGASDATAFNAAAPAVPQAPAPPALSSPPAAPAPPAIPAQYTEQCSNGVAVPNPLDNPDLVSDCAALLASKDTLEGAGRDILNWSANRAISDWDGLHVAENRVLELTTSVSRVNLCLTGTIPPELGNLDRLKHLNLHNDYDCFKRSLSLTGEIPSALGNLANLNSLVIWNNDLTGEIPAELGNLANLERLTLYRTGLTGEIPEELGNLANLTKLHLRWNSLTGEIPSELSNLAKIESLNLSGNRLTGEIPAELGNLSNLTELWLYANQLTGTIPTELGNLAKLKHLYVTNNQLRGAIPSVLGNLAKLESIHLTDNRLTGEIPSELGNLAKLRGLHLDDNQLTGEIPPGLGSLPILYELHLNGNRLTGAIPPELGDSPSFAEVRLHDNQLTGAIPPELGNIASLGELTLRGNQLTGCIPASLREPLGNWEIQRIGLPICDSTTAATPTPTPTSAPRPSATPVATPTSIPTLTATPVQSKTPVPTPTPTATPAIVIEPTPSPTATPETSEPPVATPTTPTPTATATPAIVIEPTPSPSPTATPTSVVATTDNPCIHRLTGSGSANGSWTSACLTANPPNTRDYYARFYTFTLDAASEVTITLSSADAAPYLYLLDGEGTAGAIKRETGRAYASAATITETLQPGSYTIDATTYYAGTSGDFTLEFAAAPAPAACIETLSGNGSVNGAWTAGCLSANPPNARDYYARFYTFTLDAAAVVTITLSSDDAAPYLYLLSGEGTGGAIERETGSANASAATITETLQPGSYTIDATTYYAETAGDFTLELEITQP